MNENRIDTKHILEKHALDPALIWPGEKLTYLQYFQAIGHVSEILVNKGVISGDRVAILSDINHHFPILFFAIVNLGGIVVPMNPKFPIEDIYTLLNKIDCDFLIPVNISFSIKPDLNAKVLDDILNIEIPLENKTPQKITSLSLNQDATIIFTSGTGGKSKAVLHTIGNHYYSALGSYENIPLNSSDCWMVSLPFYHIAGIAILFRTLVTGAACYIPDRTKVFQEQLYHTRVTHISLVATQLYRWLENLEGTKSESSLKAVLVGGSHVSESLLKSALQKNLPVYMSYGSTEMSSQITTTTFEDSKLNPRSSGRLLLHRELKIDSSGEVLVKGRTLGQGYISGKKALPFTDSDGWFHTGDLGYMDENQNLIVKGRQDNMFISGGENIYPEEIEQHLLFHNHIKDVCVVDVWDDEFGARPVAFVKMDGDNPINETDLKECLRDKIAAFKIPDRFYVWPKEMDGLKPDRKYLRGLATRNMRSNKNC